jgi:hypothetical protein
LVFFISDFFVEHYVGGAELTSEALINESFIPVTKIQSHKVNLKFMEKHKDSFWVFGNFSNLSEKCIMYAIKNLNYSILEYDYKFCKMRSIQKHASLENKCDCEKTRHGKLIAIFFKTSKICWFMSQKQKEVYIEKFPMLDGDNAKVLSSVFSAETIDFIGTLQGKKKNNKWIILNSKSWVKGKEASLKYAIDNDLDYELVWGLSHKDLLRKLSTSKGMIYMPPGSDTCPRLIIEAKLLGCELIMNDNVQHHSEEWFSSVDKIKKHLNSRVETFWGEIEKVWNLDTPQNFKAKEQKINLIVPFYNAESWIQKCIKSIMRQSYVNFNCYLIDDRSTDNTVQKIQDLICEDERFNLTINDQKMYALGNIVLKLNEVSHDEDVNIILDGDDWLPSKNILSFINKTYSETDCYMTYGSYVYYPTGRKGIEPSRYPDEIVSHNRFREDKWRASHLRTFKGKLFKKIKDSDLRNKNGEYYKTAYDQALMLPLLELSGDRHVFLEKIMHVYNRSNPLNVDKTKQKLQYQTALEIRQKKRYQKIK